MGKSLCVARPASAAKRKKLDLCALKPPRAVNTLRAAFFSTGFVLWDRIQWHNLTRWNTRTAWESEWDKNSGVRIFFLFFFFLANLAFFFFLPGRQIV